MPSGQRAAVVQRLRKLGRGGIYEYYRRPSCCNRAVWA